MSSSSLHLEGVNPQQIHKKNTQFSGLCFNLRYDWYIFYYRLIATCYHKSDSRQFKDSLSRYGDTQYSDWNGPLNTLPKSNHKWYSFIKCIPQLALWIIVEVVSWISIKSIKSRTVIRGPRSSDIHIFTISQEIPQPAITKIRLKITNLKFHSNFPGANELRLWNRDFQTSLVMKPEKCLSVYHQLWYRLCNTNGPLSSKRGGGGGGFKLRRPSQRQQII